MVAHSSTPTVNGLSVFDLDKTLLNCTLSFRFFCHLLKGRLFSRWRLLQVLYIGARYKLGALSAKEVHETVSTLFLESTSAQSIVKHSEKFPSLFSEAWINAHVIERLAEAKKAGHYIVLATSSPAFLVAPILSFFQVDELLASEYVIDNVSDRLRLIHAVDGQGKKEHLLKLAEKFHLPKHTLYAYSDSISDLPLLEAVGHPIVVSPDRKLRKIAHSNKWERI